MMGVEMKREHAGLVVNSIAVGIGEEKDAMRQLFFQPGLVQVCPGRIADEKLPARSEGGHDRMLCQRGRRGEFGQETRGQIHRGHSGTGFLVATAAARAEKTTD